MYKYPEKRLLDKVPIAEGEWIHLASVVNGTSALDGVYHYIDGQRREPTESYPLDDTATPGDGALFAGGPLIGSFELSLPTWLDELCFWNRKLSDQEIKDLYNQNAN